MAEQPQQAPSRTPASTQGASPPAATSASLASPLNLLGAAIVLWLGSAAAFALANYAVIALPPSVGNTARALMMAGGVVLGVVLAFVAIALLIVGSVRWAMYGPRSRPAEAATPADQVMPLLRVINARLLLSDTAKRIAYRQQDLSALRQAIRDDIAKGDFDAALVLVQEMSQTFGYREEAEALREQINAARSQDQERKISAATARLDQIINSHDFEAASREGAKLQRLYPESDAVQVAVRGVVQAREQYKHAVEREFLAAAERDDVDRAIELLQELDKYLTEEEAAPFRETARGVIGKQRDNLGVQFKIAVHDKEWMRASQVGEQIIRDFPNTRMADEVRSMLDLLRERAAGQQAVASR